MAVSSAALVSATGGADCWQPVIARTSVATGARDSMSLTLSLRVTIEDTSFAFSATPAVRRKTRHPGASPRLPGRNRLYIQLPEFTSDLSFAPSFASFRLTLEEAEVGGPRLPAPGSRAGRKFGCSAST